MLKEKNNEILGPVQHSVIEPCFCVAAFQTKWFEFSRISTSKTIEYNPQTKKLLAKSESVIFGNQLSNYKISKFFLFIFELIDNFQLKKNVKWWIFNLHF